MIKLNQDVRIVPPGQVYPVTFKAGHVCTEAWLTERAIAEGWATKTKGDAAPAAAGEGDDALARAPQRPPGTKAKRGPTENK